MSAAHRRPRHDQHSWVVALACSLMLTASSSQAGIFRDVMDKMGMSGPTPKTDAKGAPLVFPREGFSCCVLHYDGNKINDRNYASLPMIPAGTPVEVIGYDGSTAKVKIDGKAMVLDHNWGRDQESLDVWVNKVVVNEDPRPRIADYPPEVQEAIRLGKVMVGMSREEAISAIGYPVANENITLDSPIWQLRRARGDEYQLNFDRNGRIESVSGDDSVTELMIYRSKK
ncbi:MAG TPA: hypothetical protein VF848_09905 [Steroidobacteraceae bacterium]